MVLESQSTQRRVKVYLLHGDNWIDKGTGYCSGEVSNGIPFFIVRNELDDTEILLKTALQGSIQYHRQQETLIVWTDLKGRDIALSFQEPDGCSTICDFIIEVQQTLAPDISLASVISGADGDITELIAGPVSYPKDPDNENLEDVLEIINQNSTSQFTRKAISTFVQQEGYIKKLIVQFHICERERKLKSLYLLCDILKSLILYNESPIIEDVLIDEDVLSVVGILEYDPDYPNYKANHRDYLSDESKFKEVIPISDDKIKNLFKKNFILQFLKDVILARLLDDPTFNMISTLIYFNQVEIISFFQDSSNNFLQNLFGLYKDADSDHDESEERESTQKRNGVKMLHQFVLIAKSLQPHQRSEFFAVIVKEGLFKMLNFALSDEDTSIRVLGTELIVVIIEQDVSLVNYVFYEADKEVDNDDQDTSDDTSADDQTATNLKLSDDMSLISILTNLLINDKDPGLKIQAFEALKVLLDPHVSQNFNTKSSVVVNTSSYLNAFYERVASKLFKSIIDLANDEILDREYAFTDSLLFQHLCELISFCSREHETQISRPFFLEKYILLGVSKLVSKRFTLQLRLNGIRCLKNIMLLNDDFYTRYIITNNILEQYYNLLKEVKDENSLANSTCLDLLELVLKGCDKQEGKKQNFRLLASAIYNNIKDLLEDIDYVSSGKDLISLVENDFYSNNSSSTPLSNSNADFVNNVSDDSTENFGEYEDYVKISDSEDINENRGILDVIEDGAMVINDCGSNGESKANGIGIDLLNNKLGTVSGLQDSLNSDSILHVSTEGSTEKKRELDSDENLDDDNKKKISNSIKQRFSTASKKIALSIRGDNKKDKS